MQSNYIEPDLLVDVSEFWEQKMEAVEAFSSQFHTSKGDNTGDQTFISTPSFKQFLSSRARSWGQSIGVQYAEGLVKTQPYGMKDLDAVLLG